MDDKMKNELLEFELLSIQAGGPGTVDSDTYEITGDSDEGWEVSLSEKCGEAAARIKELEAEQNVVGYSELAERTALAERERDALRAHLNYIKQIFNQWNSAEIEDAKALTALILWMNCLPMASLDRWHAEMKADAIEELTFPTMLRKMWSGGEVQEWLDQQADISRHHAERIDS